jgi:hypothetical protein
MGCDVGILRGLSTSYRKFDPEKVLEPDEQVPTSFADPKT